MYPKIPLKMIDKTFNIIDKSQPVRAVYIDSNQLEALVAGIV